MHGGIVWRLALESVLDKAVLMGQSHDVFSEGSFLSLADGYLWDNILSEDELEVVCGVYKVYTGMFFVRFHFMFTYSNPSPPVRPSHPISQHVFVAKADCLA